MRSALVLVLMLISAAAAADPVTVSGNGDADTLAALTKARQRMSVCWQRKPPAKVTIKLAVAKDGQITKATAKTKGGAAQCAAGILAVTTLAPSAKAWKGSVVIATDAAGKAQDAMLVNDALVAAGDSLRGCQSAEPSFVGSLTLEVTVDPDGSLSDSAVKTDASTTGPIVACLVKAAKKITFPVLSAQVTYALKISYAGAPKATSSDDDDDLTGGQQPTRKGALEGDVISKIVLAMKASIRKCGTKGKATGIVKIRVAVDAGGKVTEAKVKSSELNDEAIEACTVKVFAKLKFPAADGETVFVYPIEF